MRLNQEADRWTQWQNSYKEAHKNVEDYRVMLSDKYSSTSYASVKEQNQLETLVSKREKIGGKMHAWLDENSMWDFRDAVSSHWVCSNLTAEQAIGDTPFLLPGESAAYGYPARDFYVSKKT